VADAKRTPYREPAHVTSGARAKSRPVMKRAAHPDDAELPTRRHASSASTSDPDAGVFSGLVSPHPASTAREAWAQRVLTLVGLPLIASTFVMIGLVELRRAWSDPFGHGPPGSHPIGIGHPLTWLLGASPIAIACYAAGVHWTIATSAIAIPYFALLDRRRLRERITARELLHAAIARETNG